VFEELTLRPVAGAVDVATVGAWLDAQPWAFRDPVDDDGWHISETSEAMERNRPARIERPREFPLGVDRSRRSDPGGGASGAGGGDPRRRRPLGSRRLLTFQVDVDAPVAAFRPLVERVSRWVPSLERWKAGEPLDELGEIHESW
jgi:hypothetical protein